VIIRGKYAALEPTAAANAVARANKSRGRRAKEPEVVEMEARGRLMAEGGRATEGNIGHFREIQFGQYLGQTFKWILENAVGWAVGFVRSYTKEGTANLSALGVNKRLFSEYCMANPAIAQAVDFSARVASASALAKSTGDDGHRLLEFSSYCDMSWCQLYESDQAEHISFVRNFILPKSDCKTGTKMDLFRQYCLQREQQRPSSQPLSIAGSSAAMQQSSGQQYAIFSDILLCIFLVLVVFSSLLSCFYCTIFLFFCCFGGNK